MHLLGDVQLPSLGILRQGALICDGMAALDILGICDTDRDPEKQDPLTRISFGQLGEKINGKVKQLDLGVKDELRFAVHKLDAAQLAELAEKCNQLGMKTEFDLQLRERVSEEVATINLRLPASRFLWPLSFLLEA